MAVKKKPVPIFPHSHNEDKPKKEEKKKEKT